MKYFLIKWKTNGTITPPQTLVVGEDYRSALINTFHHNCIDAVQTYEEVKPYFLNSYELMNYLSAFLLLCIILNMEMVRLSFNIILLY